MALLLLTVIVYVSTSSIMAVLVVLTLAAIMGFVLQRLGILKVTTSDGLNISFYEKAPAPSPPKVVLPAMNIEQKEVFYISGNDYTYEEAPAVCAAYESELATYDQLTQALVTGAEWCGYGWTQGGMALFPTQEATWKALQNEVSNSNKTACGRPGINGGYFDPESKFGVNCYGVKPEGNDLKLPLPLPGTDPLGFNKLVDRFKSMMSQIQISPFNRNEWSEHKNIVTTK